MSCFNVEVLKANSSLYKRCLLGLVFNLGQCVNWVRYLNAIFPREAGI